MKAKRLNDMSGIVLASASPRRRELLSQAGFEFDVIPSKGEEIITKEHPAAVVEELSLQKAREVAAEAIPLGSADRRSSHRDRDHQHLRCPDGA